jgi:protein TonB
MPTPQLAGTPRQAAVLATIAALHLAAFALIVSGMGPRLVIPEPPPTVTLLYKRPPPVPPQAGPAIPKPDDYALPRLPEPYVPLPRFDDPPAVAGQVADLPDGAAGAGPTMPTPMLQAPSLRSRNARLAALVESCYPSGSRRLGEEGRVIVRLDIDAGGAVRRWNVVEGSGFQRLDAAVDCVVRRLEFNPGLRDGEAVAASVQLPVVFRLN